MKKKKLKENILAEGEATGHAHRVTVAVYEREDGLREFSGKTKVTHEEHGPIEIPEGAYVTGQIMEYDYLKEMERKVVD